MFNSLGNSISRAGLVGEWLLDGNALDTSGNGNNGTNSNGVYVKTYKGYQNKAWQGNGLASTNINIPFTALGNGTYSFSFIFKSAININNGDYNYILDFSTTNVTQNRFSIRVMPTIYGGFLRVYVKGGGSEAYRDSLLVLNDNNYHIGYVYVNKSTSTINIYIDGILNQSVQYGGVIGTVSTNNSFRLGSYHDGNSVGGFVGDIQNLRIYNRELTQDEIQLLYLEGQKLLGPTSIAKYPKLFEGLVGYFENPTGTTELWDIANGVNSTRVAGSNTTDNLGNNRALSNPNYTWTSITYTTGYTFENSGSGWSIVTNPLGLLGTGINRVTTLRNVFLFTRTLSSDEVTLLQNLCNSNYIYPSPSYDILNLRDGLVLDLNEQGKDLSGNGNHGTLVNSPVVVRQGKAKGLSYNGSNQYIDFGNILDETGSNPFSLEVWYRPNSILINQMIMGKQLNSGSFGGYILWGQFLSSPNRYRLNITLVSNDGTFGSIEVITPDNELVVGKWYHIVATYDGSKTANGTKIYIDAIPKGTTAANTLGTKSISTTANFNIGSRNNGNLLTNGMIFMPKKYNRALSDKEIQQLYYSKKGNFIY